MRYICLGYIESGKIEGMAEVCCCSPQLTQEQLDKMKLLF
jgi:hypothetical protein